MPGSTSNNRRCIAGRRNRSALVLVLVLIVVMMVALAGFTFAELMLTENKATRLHGEQLRLQQAIHSGVEQLKLFAEQSTESQQAAGGAHNNPRMFQAVPLEPELRETSTPVNRLRFSIVATVAESDAASTSSAQNPGIRFGVENESGRLHLADLLRYEQQVPNGGRDALMKLPGMTESVAEAIMDWIDGDALPRSLGEEKDYYEALEQPYSPRNGLPDCLEELLLIKGVTRELLFGADANYNRTLEPGELAQAAVHPTSASSPPTVPWSWLLTVHSGQRNRNSQGRPRIRLNGPNLVALHQQLTAAVGPELAALVVAFRQFGPDTHGGLPQSGVVPVEFATSPNFVLSSVLDLVDVNVQVSVAGKPATYASPLTLSSPSLAAQLTRLQDVATVDAAPVLRGRVSVNDAPLAVLQAVPGIDEQLAQQIVATRQNPASGDDGLRRFPTWLLTEGLVDLETMKRLLPNLSGSGDVVRAQVVAHFDQPGLSARTEVVIDATGEAPRVGLWRDLRYYGAGYPTEWLTAGAPRGARN